MLCARFRLRLLFSTQYAAAPKALDSAVTEILEDVKDLGDANPRIFDWDMSIYNLHKPAVDGGGGGGDSSGNE